MSALRQPVPTFYVNQGYRMAMPPKERRMLAFLSVLFECAIDGTVAETQSELAARVGACERTVRTWELRLEELGILARKKQGARRRVLKMLQPPPPSLQHYRKSLSPPAASKPRPQGVSQESVSAPNALHQGGGDLHEQGRAAGASREGRKRAGGGGGSGRPPSQPPTGALIYDRYIRPHLKDPDVLARIERLTESYGAEGITVWVRECINRAQAKYEHPDGPAGLLRTILLRDDVPAQQRNVREPQSQWDKTKARMKEWDESFPGDHDCPWCRGTGHLNDLNGDPPAGADFHMWNPFSKTNYYHCPCVVRGKGAK